MFNFNHYLLTKEVTFSEIAKNWLNYKSNSVKESTYYKYKYVIDKYLISSLKNISLKKLSQYDFNLLIQSFNYLDKSTIKLLITVLKSILNFAERKYDMDLKTDLIKYINKTQIELQVFTAQEKQKLINYCYNDFSLKSIGILISLYTGLRIGELCALKWQNIDLEKDTISITQTLQRVYTNNSTHILIDSPKSSSSFRKIPINKKLHNILYRLNQTNTYTSTTYFLTGSNDKFIEPRNYQYTFKQILKNLNLPNYNFHILRHTFATDCININMDVKSLSQILGHSNINITLSKYVHPSFENTKKYLEKI